MRYEGYHEASALPLKRGQKIVIPAGVTVRSMKPGKADYVTKRSQTVTIHMFINGQSVRPRVALGDKDYFYPLKEKGFDFSQLEAWREANAPEYYHSYVPISNPKVSWAGAGGYWCDVDINDILEANGVA